MARRKKGGRKTVTHAAYTKLVKRYRKGHKGAELSKALGHKPIRLLEQYARKMPEHYAKLQRTIARRKASGE
jgi:hypothetical protein